MAGAERRGAEAIRLATEMYWLPRSGANSRDYHNDSRSEGRVTDKINVYAVRASRAAFSGMGLRTDLRISLLFRHAAPKRTAGVGRAGRHPSARWSR